MKRFQTVLCTLVLALSLSSAASAGTIHGTSAGTIHGANATGILVSDLFSWGDITGGIVSTFGYILSS